MSTAARKFHRRIMGLAALTTGLGVLAAAIAPLASADVSGYVSTANAADTFARTVASGGWGSAPTGGAWSVEPSASFSVASRGVITYPAARTHGAAYLPVSAPDENVRVQFSVSAVPSGFGSTYTSTVLRRNGAAMYRVRLKIGVGGVGTIAFMQGVNATTENKIGADVAVPFTITAGMKLNLDSYVTGSTTPQLGARVWREGTSVPAWTTVKDATTTALRTAGQVGVFGYSTTPLTNLQESFHKFEAFKLTVPVNPEPPVPDPTAPTPVKPPSVDPDVNGARGSAPLGSTNYPIPSGAIFVSPNGKDSNPGTIGAPLKTLQRACNIAVNGKTIVLRGGLYHEQVIVPAKYVIIQNYPGEVVWLDGSVPVTNWSAAANGTWISTGWTKTFPNSTSFTSGPSPVPFAPPGSMATYGDQLFIDGVQQRQVSASTTPGPGQFSVNNATDTITIGSDPTGRSVRATDLERALVNSGRLTFRGIGVRRYGTPLRLIAAVYIGGWYHTVIENVIIDSTATQGISVTSYYASVNRLTATGNGMTGLHTNHSDYLTLKNSLFVNNNWEHFNPTPATSGIKFSRTRHVSVLNNTVTDNWNSNGIWMDESTVNFSIVGNVVKRNNSEYAVLAELSDTGVIANNYVANAKYGISAFDAGNIKIFHNIIDSTTNFDVGLWQDQRRQATWSFGRDPRMPVPDPTCPWITRNIVIANNIFAHTRGGTNTGYQILAQDKKTGIPADDMNITINGNVQYSPSTGPYGWGQANASIVTYWTPEALAAAKNPSWKNVQTRLTLPSETEAAQWRGNSVPLPADVAALMGYAAGTKLAPGTPVGR